MNFYKYQSLGNDFIILNESVLSVNKIKELCDRHFGIGADGILTVIEKNIPKITIYNADGTEGEICLNGVRCVTLHLINKHNYTNSFNVNMGNKIIHCQKNDSIITNSIKIPQYIEEKIIEKYTGHVVLAPNPHFIIFEKIDINWLKNNGSTLESHPYFPNKTNVEFVWQVDSDSYDMLVYERGCGITLSCGSGAAAVLSTLFHLKKIDINEKIKLNMPGGTLICWINKNQELSLQATAALIFEGKIQFGLT